MFIVELFSCLKTGVYKHPVWPCNLLGSRIRLDPVKAAPRSLLVSVITNQIPIQEATRETIAPFGFLIDMESSVDALPTAFYEGTVRVYSPSEFQTDEDTDLTVAVIDRRPLRVQWMERHFKHTQTFIPLEGKPFVLVLAPPSDENDLPSIENARAFLFDGSTGLAIKIGTWHEFPFAIADQTKLVVVIRNEATKNLLKSAVSDGEAHGPDLDKKDISKRLGVCLTPVF